MHFYSKDKITFSVSYFRIWEQEYGLKILKYTPSGVLLHSEGKPNFKKFRYIVIYKVSLLFQNGLAPNIAHFEQMKLKAFI